MKKVLPIHQEHPRSFEQFRFVYPVVSRRSGGVSIGVNLNPDTTCNFDCVYCQVDRQTASRGTKFDVTVAETELRAMLALMDSGELARHARFSQTPAEWLRLKDVALSGDGEPTLTPEFGETVEMVARIKPRGIKLILITNAAGLDRTAVKRGLTVMDHHDGEIWAKLDAGTEEYFKLVDRSNVPLSQILKNLTGCAKARPIVVQSLFMKLYGHGPSAEEVTAYCDRLNEILASGGRIKAVQVGTVARKPMAIIHGRPAWNALTALADAELDAIRDCVRHRTGLPAESWYGAFYPDS